MNYWNIAKYTALMALTVCTTWSCKDLTELNINPNGVNEENANPNLVMTNVLTNTGVAYNALNYEDLGGLMQHTQKINWQGSHNNYEWNSILDWSKYYNILRDNELLRRGAQEQNLAFHEGVSLVMRAYVFGLVTDMWGDAPYTDALKADIDDDVKYRFPKYDSQETIYKGILEELKQANDLLSQPDDSYSSILPSADVYFAGKASKWRRFANSLALRYYMRLSHKLPDFARQGIENITTQPNLYPIITDVADEASMAFVGNGPADSWPVNTVFEVNGRSFRGMRMCATLVDYMQQANDPRLSVWAAKVQTPIRIDASQPARTDKMVDGVRIFSPDMVANIAVDTDPDYVGVPPSVSQDPSTYNMNPTPGQEAHHPHVSGMNPIYQNAKGDLLKARMLTAAEVNFILAEAAFKGWNVGNAKDHYEKAIRTSLEAWGKGADYASYIAQPTVAYNNSEQQIIEQKWVASWTTTAQSWFDFRRTGFPALKAGPVALRTVLPIRLAYFQTEVSVNRLNVEDALTRIEKSPYSQADNENSSWSKIWLVQGTNNPW